MRKRSSVRQSSPEPDLGRLANPVPDVASLATPTSKCGRFTGLSREAEVWSEKGARLLNSPAQRLSSGRPASAWRSRWCRDRTRTPKPSGTLGRMRSLARMSLANSPRATLSASAGAGSTAGRPSCGAEGLHDLGLTQRLGADEVDRSGEVLVDQMGQRPDLVVQRDPAPVLPPRAQRTGQAQPCQREHPLHGATIGVRTSPVRACTTRSPASWAGVVAASQARTTSARKPCPAALSSVRISRRGHRRRRSRNHSRARWARRDRPAPWRWWRCH